jgi:Protein of unknown function (DUF3142)
MRLALTILLLPVLLALLVSKGTTQREVILWAWERPEDLTFIDPHKTSVAFLAKTIYLRGDKVVVRPRLQPVKIAPGTKLVSVVRIETDHTDLPTLSFVQAQQTAREILNSSVSSVVQIDFDAKVSERNFYRLLLQEVRHQLPASTKLSITALASWCAGDDWLRDLPIDEAVPMLFRLGVDQRQFQRRLETGEPFASRFCQNSAGVSTDERVTAPAVDRLYIFSPRPWTRDSFTAATETYKK